MPMNRKNIFESFTVGGLLAIVGGYLDSYTYVIRGGVFSNAQTGNIILCAINLSEGSFNRAIYYSIPVISFIIGILLSEYAKKKFISGGIFHWRHIMIIVEMIILSTVAFLPKGDWDFMANILVSLTCAIQVETFRTLYGNPYATTMCTGNLRSGTEKLFFFIINRNNHEKKSFIQYYSIILFFVVGVIIGNVLTKVHHEMAILYTVGILFIVFLLLLLEERSE